MKKFSLIRMPLGARRVVAPCLFPAQHSRPGQQGIYHGLFSLALLVGSGQNGKDSQKLVRVGSSQASQDFWKMRAVILIRPLASHLAPTGNTAPLMRHPTRNNQELPAGSNNVTCQSPYSREPEFARALDAA
jgi:hypothetical protein